MQATVAAGVKCAARQRNAEFWVPHEGAEEDNEDELKNKGEQRQAHCLQHVALLTPLNRCSSTYGTV